MSNQNFASDTSGRSVKEWMQGLLVLLIGLTIAHLGITLFLLAGLGSDAFTVLVQGIAKKSGLSIGTCQVISFIVLMAIMFFTTKGYVKPGTVVCAFCGGWIIDFFLWLFGGLVTENSPLLFRIIVMVAGCVVLSLGMSIVVKSNSGTGPNDLIAIILTDKLNKRFRAPFGAVRVTCDLALIAAGMLLGGTFGVGTIAAAVLIGPMAQVFFPVSGRIIYRIFPALQQ